MALRDAGPGEPGRVRAHQDLVQPAAAALVVRATARPWHSWRRVSRSANPKVSRTRGNSKITYVSDL